MMMLTFVIVYFHPYGIEQAGQDYSENASRVQFFFVFLKTDTIQNNKKFSSTGHNPCYV